MGRKVYFALWLLLHAGLYLPDFADRLHAVLYLHQPFYLVDIILTATSAVGLFGYSFGRTPSLPWLWRTLPFAQFACDLAGNFSGYVFPPILIVLLLMMLFLIPGYIMVFRYGHKTSVASAPAGRLN